MCIFSMAFSLVTRGFVKRVFTEDLVSATKALLNRRLSEIIEGMIEAMTIDLIIFTPLF